MQFYLDIYLQLLTFVGNKMICPNTSVLYIAPTA